jgi:hypothetical protein
MRSVLSFLFFLLLAISYPVAGLLAAEGSAEAVPSASMDFLYINANTGEAAGGHTALRLGDTIFHYQFFPDATFLLVREPWDGFRFLYNDLHNRSISTASLSLRPSVAKDIRAYFTERLAAQNQFFDDLQTLTEEEDFLREILSGSSEREIAGRGFFADAMHTDPGERLAGRLEYLLGGEGLKGERTLARQNLQKNIALVNRGQGSWVALEEAVALLEALGVLMDGQGLAPDALIPAVQGELPLSQKEQLALEEFGEFLVTGIAELIHSSRPDRGTALLLQTARYHAVRSSLTSKAFLSLDPFFADVRVVQLTEHEALGPQVKSLQRAQLARLLRRRALFVLEQRHPEIAYSLLETSRARAWELMRVNDTHRGVRLLAQVIIPSRPGVVLVPGISPKQDLVQERLSRVQEELQEQQALKKQRYGYNLFTRNCATELTRSLNNSFDDMESGKTALGGWLEPGSGLSFIPFLFYRESVAAYSLEEEQFLPARRIRNLETLYEEDNDVLVWLRESNTLSSTLYERRSADTTFLFFTDDSLVLRPLLGVMNVLYGTVNGLGGIVAAPFDGGSHFKQSLRGIFYSLPVLGFANIRKGSYGVGESSMEDPGTAILGNRPTSL